MKFMSTHEEQREPKGDDDVQWNKQAKDGTRNSKHLISYLLYNCFDQYVFIERGNFFIKTRQSTRPFLLTSCLPRIPTSQQCFSVGSCNSKLH